MQQSDLGFNLSTKKTRKRKFLEQMQQVVPWKDLVDLIAPYAPEGRRGRPPFPVEMLLRIHFTQQWFTLSDTAMEGKSTELIYNRLSQNGSDCQVRSELLKVGRP